MKKQTIFSIFLISSYRSIKKTEKSNSNSYLEQLLKKLIRQNPPTQLKILSGPCNFREKKQIVLTKIFRSTTH